MRDFMVYKFFDEMSASKSSPENIGSGININTNNQQLAKELYKPIIRKFKKRTVYSELRDNIGGADLADMQLISKFDKKNLDFYCVLLIFLVNILGLFL